MYVYSYVGHDLSLMPRPLLLHRSLEKETGLEYLHHDVPRQGQCLFQCHWKVLAHDSLPVKLLQVSTSFMYLLFMGTYTFRLKFEFTIVGRLWYFSSVRLNTILL